MCVLHRCDTPACINPDHLFLGTRHDNNLDRDKKGRQVAGGNKGVERYNAKLTDEIVKSIRSDPRSHRKIGAEYSISYSIVRDIKIGKRWRHVL